jgi:hypothetical protein
MVNDKGVEFLTVVMKGDYCKKPRNKRYCDHFEQSGIWVENPVVVAFAHFCQLSLSIFHVSHAGPCDLKQLEKLFALVADQSMWTSRDLREVFVHNLANFCGVVSKAFLSIDLYVATNKQSAQVQGSVGGGHNGSQRTEVGQSEKRRTRKPNPNPNSFVLSDSSELSSSDD